MLDLSSMTLEELKVLRRDINNALQSFDSNRKRQALREVREVCKKYGYDLKDLVGQTVPAVKKAQSS